MELISFLLAIVAFSSFVHAQQYMGDFINNSLPIVPGAEITFFRIPDPAGKNKNLTLINYYSHGTDGNRIVESKIQRAIIVIHGLNRDPGTYESNALSALYQITNPDISFDTVAVIAPYFPNGDDKNVGYPWNAGAAAGLGSYTNALVWPGSQWSAGGNAQYPNAQKGTISSYYVLDTLIKYFDDKTLFPNVKQIVVAGHSLGAQTVQRYAAIGKQLNTKSPISYWVANPNSYVWMNTTRPFDTSSCPTYDTYREGYTNFTTYPMTYATDLVAQGRAAILSNFNSKAVAYARGLLDLGDDSSSCAPFTTGGNRNERFFNFIKTFPPSCTNPSGTNCDTIDLINVGHDSGQMMASPAGQARLFLDNFYGNGSRAYDFGYPRQQIGDDPFPDPAQNGSITVVNNGTYAGNMTYFGCWSDQDPASLPYFAYDNSSNTIEVCTATCNSLGYSIAGVEYSSQCFCGNTLTYKAQQVIDSSCNFQCSGNTNETCGGFSRMSVFSRGTPAQYTPPKNLAAVGPYQYSSCVLEVPGRALTAAATTSDSLTVESCAAFCSGYKYFATEYKSECYCGDVLQSGANVTSSGDCGLTCSGNPLEICGGANRLSLYTLGSGSSVPATSSTISISTIKTTSSATPSASPVVCPASNNTIVGSNGGYWLVECQLDHYGGDMGYVAVTSLQACIDACATTQGCIDVSLSGTACYMKNALGQGNINTGVNGARYIGNVSTTLSSAISSTSAIVTSTTSSTSFAVLSSSTPISSSAVMISTGTSSISISATAAPTPISCPSANSTIDNAFNQKTFLIECGIDHYAGDMGMVYVSDFLGCINACANATGCVDVSLSGQACYLKNSVGGPNNNGVWGARLVTVTSSASSISTTVTTIPVLSTSSITTSSTASTSSKMITTSTASSTSTTTSSTIATIVTSSTAAATSSLTITTSSATSTTVVTTTTSAAYSSVSGYAYPTLTSGFQYVGCYTDGGTRAFTYSNGSSSSTTPQGCAQTCRALGYRYAGTEYSSECWCDNYLTSAKASDTDCANTCSGDAKQNCGGGYRLSVTQDINWKQTLFTRQKYSSWNVVGCYQDNVNSRVLGSVVTVVGGNSNTTIANCLTACAASGYKYCGAEYASECYGSSTAPTTSVLSGDPLAAGCNYACAANSTEACGGSSKITIYINNGTVV
ncbi:hypothetical protein AMS68_003024 [Peltaster fructicola]|uniref:WSC domain-containing protein n=1 Tax=Peltaster fructicola TaxID=286661 RepID=A0A6H0XRX2_9PEZI|nr:hypothetical protein AMS68_003024 [Peltaster fructicola]